MFLALLEACMAQCTYYAACCAKPECSVCARTLDRSQAAASLFLSRCQRTEALVGALLLAVAASRVSRCVKAICTSSLFMQLGCAHPQRAVSLLIAMHRRRRDCIAAMVDVQEVLLVLRLRDTSAQVRLQPGRLPRQCSHQPTPITIRPHCTASEGAACLPRKVCRLPPPKDRCQRRAHASKRLRSSG
jgi:hypothetical protein